MRFLIVGDTHARLDLLYAYASTAREVVGADAIIQVGDFGFFPPTLVRFERQFQRFPIPVHAIDGNHEDHQWLQRCIQQGDVADWARKLNLLYHARGTISEHDGVRIGWLGGALHIDRQQEGLQTHWRLGIEPPACNWIRPSDRDLAIQAWRASPPDFVVTHSLPCGIGVGMAGDPACRWMVEDHVTSQGWSNGPANDVGDTALHEVYRSLTSPPSAWVFGHFHTFHRRTVGTTEFLCVGSGDNTDGHEGLAQTVIYDTATRRLEIGGALS